MMICQAVACPDCFHASVTRQRSAGSETRFSCPHVLEPTLANKNSRKRVPHKVMLENLVDSGNYNDPDGDCRTSTES